MKVNVYTPAGKHVGYFLDPQIESFPDGDYEISGKFMEESGEPAQKLEFNPQAMPYSADVAETSLNIPSKKLVNVYVQRGRQPVVMSGQASK